MRTDHRHLLQQILNQLIDFIRFSLRSDLCNHDSSNCSFDQSFHVHALLILLRIFEFWIGLWTVRRKDGTAIFERLDRDLKGIDGLGDIDNLQLIHGHHWTDNWGIGHGVDGLHTL